MNVDKQLDVRGLACPMPLIQTKKAITDLESGQVMEIATTDAGAKADLSMWSKSSGHEFLDSKEDEGTYTIWIKKG
ncbi:sulfurtransferase TusA family protein [Pontibacillus salicampi]|uniref:Sulfurtransferase TusA family protein n=1 Tax=Pontibacillus salicampi TaxID=1449801 RepID=A0ABV6LR20_9BACI